MRFDLAIYKRQGTIRTQKRCLACTFGGHGGHLCVNSVRGSSIKPSVCSSARKPRPSPGRAAVFPHSPASSDSSQRSALTHAGSPLQAASTDTDSSCPLKPPPEDQRRAITLQQTLLPVGGRAPEHTCVPVTLKTTPCPDSHIGERFFLKRGGKKNEI